MCSVFDKNLTCTILAYILYLYLINHLGMRKLRYHFNTTGIDMDSSHSPFKVFALTY